MDSVIQAVSHIHWTQQKSRNPVDKHNDLLFLDDEAEDTFKSFTFADGEK